MKIMSMVAAAFVLAVAGGDAAAQQRSLKERLVGTWHLVLSEVTSPDGTKSLPFGPNPAGVMMFAADGNYTHIHVAAEVPKIANNHRLKATPEEYAGIVRGSIAQFGTWTIDEEKRHLILKIVTSTFANWRGITQTRLIAKLTDDEFVNTNPDVGAGRGSSSNLYRRAK
jgi:Lipocalin-like domain